MNLDNWNNNGNSYENSAQYSSTKSKWLWFSVENSRQYYNAVYLARNCKFSICFLSYFYLLFLIKFFFLQKTGELSPKLSSLLFHLTFTLLWVQVFLMCLSLVGLLSTSFCLARMLTRRLQTNIVIISHEVQPINKSSDKIPI